jgi:hypothetical protein
LPDKYEWPDNVSHVAYNPWVDLRWRNDVKKLKLRCPWEKIPSIYTHNIYIYNTLFNCVINTLISVLNFNDFEHRLKCTYN